MGLPVAALSDRELMHYAGIDEAAQLELAKRSVDYQDTYLNEVEKLQKEVTELKSELEDAGSGDAVASSLASCIFRVHGMLKGFESMDAAGITGAIKSALKEMEQVVDCSEEQEESEED